jgi:hypothetical protein
LRAPWPLAIAVAVAALIVVDLAFRALWHPHPTRLPEQFSTAYLNAYVDTYREGSPVLVVGDSALWGYELPPREAPVEQLEALRPHDTFLNLSYEGGSIVNSLYALRLVLARGVRPSVVIVNLNNKEFNAADSAYKRLLPALERAVSPQLAARDRALLTTLPAPTLADRLDALVGSVWALYRQRVDVRVALFGQDDFAGLLTAGVHYVTGEQRRYEQSHRPTPAAFLGTYDLDPIAGDNVEEIALRELRDELVREHIPAIAFLTPTNHALLAGTTSDPGYAVNLATIARTMRGPGIDVVDLDRLDVGPHFLDNDHLDAAGARVLALRLAHELDSIRR